MNKFINKIIILNGGEGKIAICYKFGNYTFFTDCMCDNCRNENK